VDTYTDRSLVAALAAFVEREPESRARASDHSSQLDIATIGIGLRCRKVLSPDRIAQTIAL